MKPESDLYATWRLGTWTVPESLFLSEVYQGDTGRILGGFLIPVRKQLYEAISKMYPFWNRDEFRLYGRCGDVYMPIKNYLTLAATLRHMASYASDLLYLVRTDIIEERLMTVEELKKRWHVREAEQEEADVKIIQKWFGDQGYEGRIPEIRGEHAPPQVKGKKPSYADSDLPTSSKGSNAVRGNTAVKGHHKK